MIAPAFTILLPVIRPPALLPYAITSVLAQDRQDFELFVICDGAPPETASRAREFAASDARIRVFEHPKGEGHGEAYRHQALEEARGEYVCHIGDDDLWLPNHLTEVAALLREFDFGNLPHVEVLPDGRINVVPGDLANAKVRRRIMGGPFSIFGMTEGAYRLGAYRALPTGWSPSLPGVASDLHMWRKFLACDDLRFGTRIVVTSVKFARARRGDWSLDRRLAESAAWARQLSSPGGRDAFTQASLRQLSQAVYDLRLRVGDLDAAAKDAAARAAAAEEARRQLNHTPDDLRRQVEHLDQAAKESVVRTEELNKQLRQVRAELRDSLRRSDKLHGKLRALRQTVSWRVTRPFRRLARMVTR